MSLVTIVLGLLLTALPAIAQTALAHWTFATGTAADLTAGGHTLAALGSGAISHSSDSGGYVSLPNNALLVSTSINSNDTPDLGSAATFIITMRYDEPSPGGTFNWGIFNNTTSAGTDWQHATLVGMNSGIREGVYTKNGVNEAFPNTASVPDVGDWFTLVAIYDSARNNGRLDLFLNGAYVQTATGITLNAFQAFGIGRIKEGAGVSMSFADVQIYDSALNEATAVSLGNAALASTAVPEPQTAVILLGVAATLSVVFARTCGRNRPWGRS
ncbi:hypothetical protein OPIT5_13030 [Opitutaceae bacterium TAV5]|nr:hypothetical protein OPIT5_13030 [Opitutaceae bacterium TAV5]